MILRFQRPGLAGMLLLSTLSGACSAAWAPGGPRAREIQSTFATVQAQLAATAAAASPSTPPAGPVGSSLLPTPAASFGSPDSVLASAPSAAAPSAFPSAAPPPKVGQTVKVTTEAGEQLAVSVNRVIDPARSTNAYTQPKGRWVVLDWTLANQGSIGHSMYAVAFVLQTEDGFVYGPGLSTGLPEPELLSRTVFRGELARGYLSYDVPVGARLKSAIYQPIGNPQFLVADLTH